MVMEKSLPNGAVLEDVEMSTGDLVESVQLQGTGLKKWHQPQIIEIGVALNVEGKTIPQTLEINSPFTNYGSS
jgi:hypothetical protein